MNKSIRTMRTLIVVLALAFAIAPLAEAGQAEPRYHLITFADVGPASAITDSGVILAGNKVVKPARDAAGNPVWDSDGDGVADGYTVITLDAGPGEEAYPQGINEALDVVGYTWAAAHQGYTCGNAVLWRRGPDGAYTLVNLGSAFTAAEREAFAGDLGMYDVGALDINDRGQVLVCEAGEDWSAYDPDDPHPPSDSIGALVVITPRDVNGDGEPDTWFEDVNQDGANDLMAPVELHAVSDPFDMNQWHGTGRINNLGQVVAASFVPGRGIFVVVPKDMNGDGVPDRWFEEGGEPGSNALATDLAFGAAAVDISDSGVVVGSENTYSLDDQYARWQIDGAGSVALVAQESGECDVDAVNNQGDALGYRRDRDYSFLWEADGTIIKLLDLLDNPKDAARNMRARDISNTDCIVGESNGKAFVAVPLTQAPPPATPGITVSPTDGLITTEDGVTDTFTIVLDTQPTAGVAIGLSSSDESEGLISTVGGEPAKTLELTFTPANWDQPQTVTVTGVDDAIEDGDALYTILTAPAVSTDPDYSGLDAADVDAVNLDDDAPSGGVAVVSVTAGDIRLGGKYNIAASIRNDGAAAVTIHVDCEVEDSDGGIQELITRAVTIEPGATVKVRFSDYSDSSLVSAGTCTAWITVQEDPTADGSDTFTLK